MLRIGDRVLERPTHLPRDLDERYATEGVYILVPQSGGGERITLHQADTQARSRTSCQAPAIGASRSASSAIAASQSAGAALRAA
jgi:hypothetical protein